jgi:hypothetical protein
MDDKVIQAMDAAEAAQPQGEAAVADGQTEGTDKPDQTGVSADAAVTETEETKESPKKEDSFSRKFQALARKDRQLRDRETAIKAHERELKDWKAAVSSAKENPLKALEQLGLTYDDLVNHVIYKDSKPTETERMSKELEEMKRSLNEREEQQVQKQVTAFHDHISNMIATDDSYELLRVQTEAGLIDGPREVMEYVRVSHENGRPVRPEQAAAALETYLEEQTERVLRTKKIAAKNTGTTTTKAANGNDDGAKSKARTLTNSMSSAVPNKGSSTERRLTRDERRELALAQLK